jgi:hypothetical protein
MRQMEETMPILCLENDPKRINTLKEIEIMKAFTSNHMLNTMQINNPLYKILQPLQDQTATSAESYRGCPYMDEWPTSLIQNFNEE